MKFLIGNLDPINTGGYDGSGINPNSSDFLTDAYIPPPESKNPSDGGNSQADLDDQYGGKLDSQNTNKDNEAKKINWALISILGIIGLAIVFSRKGE